MKDYKDIFAGFSRRRSIFWYLCLGPAMAILTFFPFGRAYDWLWLVPVLLLAILGTAEYVRYRIKKRGMPGQ